MVQVDVFWSYALGAVAAVAATRQIARRKREEPQLPWWSEPSFTFAVLFLSIGFAPSGIYLLWAFPSWETMHAGDRDMPAWLVTLFAATNITQGILGYWVAYRLIGAGRRYLAHLQVVLGYFFMLFILVHGWDGTGYQRFFSPTRADFEAWTIATVPRWLVSDVAIALLGLGVFLLPPLFWGYTHFLQRGYALAGLDAQRVPGAAAIIKNLLTMVGLTIAMAVVASILVHLFGWIVGPAVFVVVAFAAGVRRGGLYHVLYARLQLEEPDAAHSEQPRLGDPLGAPTRA